MNNMRASKEFIRGMIVAYYNKDGNICGGNLHILLDDLNTNDDDILWCLDNSVKDDYDAFIIATELLKYPEDERKWIITGEYEAFDCIKSIGGDI